MTEELLSPEIREWLDNFMKEIGELPGSGNKEACAEYRAQIVSGNLEYNHSVKAIAHIVFCVISAGIFGERVLPVFHLILQLAVGVGISPAVSTNMVICLINTGLMNLDKIGEPVSERVLSHMNFRPFQKLQSEKPMPKPRAEGGSGEVGDTIQLARHILIHQEVPCDGKEQRTLARWCLSLACIFNGETLKQLAQCKLEKEKDNEDESGQAEGG